MRISQLLLKYTGAVKSVQSMVNSKFQWNAPMLVILMDHTRKFPKRQFQTATIKNFGEDCAGRELGSSAACSGGALARRSGQTVSFDISSRSNFFWKNKIRMVRFHVSDFNAAVKFANNVSCKCYTR